MNDEKRYATAHEQGRAARRGGKPRSANPYQGSTKLLRDLHEQHELGWLAQDSENLAARRRAR